jgi:hypothetical protein
MYAVPTFRSFSSALTRLGELYRVERERERERAYFRKHVNCSTYTKEARMVGLDGFRYVEVEVFFFFLALSFRNVSRWSFRER